MNIHPSKKAAFSANGPNPTTKQVLKGQMVRLEHLA